jgi:hypothetical protein
MVKLLAITWEASAGALAACVTAAAAAYGSWRNGKKIGEVHVMVNSRLDAALDRIDQLTESLEGSDTVVPDDPNPPDIRRQGSR